MIDFIMSLNIHALFAIGYLLIGLIIVIWTRMRDDSRQEIQLYLVTITIWLPICIALILDELSKLKYFKWLAKEI